MTDLDTLERDLLAQVSAASDEATLDAVRVAALGKKGSVSDLLKTLGSMTPEERKVHMERQQKIKQSAESPYSTANMKTPAIPEGLKGEEQMSAWIAQNRVELVANLMEGEIGEALAQSSASSPASIPPPSADTSLTSSRARAAPRRDSAPSGSEQPADELSVVSLGAPTEQQHLWWDGRKILGANHDERMERAWHRPSHKTSRRALSDAQN